MAEDMVIFTRVFDLLEWLVPKGEAFPRPFRQTVTARLLGKQGGAKPGAFGRLKIETTPPSDAYLAGDLLGRTPIETVYAPLGMVTLDFELPGGRKVSRKVQVKKDGIARVRFDLTRGSR